MDAAIVNVRWVHVFEEDTADGAVYAPDGPTIPLSRRPREALTLHTDGTAIFEVGGPDDRPRPHRSRWRHAPGGITIDVALEGGNRQFVVVEATSRRLVLASR